MFSILTIQIVFEYSLLNIQWGVKKTPATRPNLESDKTLIKSQKSVVTLPAGFTDEVAVLTVENMLRWNNFFNANLQNILRKKNQISFKNVSKISQ